MKKVSIVIVTWNSSKTIRGCLDSIRKIEDGEVFVVDNNSSDDVVGKIEKYPWVKLIKNKSNLGFGRANNLVLRKIINEFKFIFLLNPDAQLTNGALGKMIEFMEENKDVGVLGPKLLNFNDSLQKEITPFPNLLNQILILLRLHRLPWFSKLVYPNYDYNKIQEVEHLMGSALLIRKEVFEKIGFFDENFFLWFEETDLEKRAKEAGFKIVYYPKAEVHHLRSFSSRKMSRLKRQIIWNNSLRYYFKNHGFRLEQFILEPFILLSYILAFLLLLKDKIIK